jgi:hypothetical protein
MSGLTIIELVVGDTYFLSLKRYLIIISINPINHASPTNNRHCKLAK